MRDKDRRQLKQRERLIEDRQRRDARRFDKRTSPPNSIDEPQFIDDAVSSRALLSREDDLAGNDSLRAVGKFHQKDNSTTDRILASGGTDAERAVAANHQKNNSTDERVLASGTTDAERAVRANHQKNNSTDERVLASGSTNAERAVDTAHQKDNSTTSRVLQGHASDNSQRAVEADHQKNNSTTSRILSAHGSDNSQRAVDQDHLKDDIVGEFKLHSSIKSNANALDYAARQLKGTGNDRAAAHWDHFHAASVSFKMIPRPARLAALGLRETIRNDATMDPNIKQAILLLLHLACDDPEMTAEEREERIGEEPGFEAAHLEETGVNHPATSRFHQTPHDDLTT